MEESQELRRAEIRKIFKRHRGAAYQLARDLNCSRVTVSDWLRGRVKSARIAKAAHARAYELLAEERGRLAAA